MKLKIALTGIAVSAGMIAELGAQTFNDGSGREWLQPGDTYRAKWSDIALVCPQDGATRCNGSVPRGSSPSYDVTDWIWATQSQIRTLYSYYTPDILSSDFLSGAGYLNSANSFLTGLTPTNSVVCAGGCPAGQYYNQQFGWTATKDAAGVPIRGRVEAQNTTVQNGVFGFELSADGQSVSRGIYLWRPTGLGTGIVYANTDSATVIYGMGGTVVQNVLANDWNNGVRATVSNVILSADSSTDPGISLNPSTGAVTVATTAAPGYQNLAYHICSTTTSSCAAAVARVTLPVHVVPFDDTGASVSTAGGVPVTNVLANDVYYADGYPNGPAPATTSNVTIQQLTFPPGITLNTSTGEVTVAPNTAPGFKEISYRICDRVVPTYCGNANTARVMFNVYDSNATVTANPDSFTATSASGGSFNVLMNDTIGTQQANVYTNANVALVQSSPQLTLNTSTGLVIAPAGLAAGNYWLDYRACDQYNTTNCATARATVTVPVTLTAGADTGTVTTSGGVAIANVLANDRYGTIAASSTNVSLTMVQTTAGISLDTATGRVTVSSGTASGTYALDYRICDRSYSINCATARATVTVRANVIDAVADTGSIPRAGGVAIANVLANDRLEGAIPTTSTVRLTAIGTIPPGLSLSTNTGAISVAKGTASGTYSITYQICETAMPTNCDRTTDTVQVTRR
jgi:large repetitive protein